MSIEENNNYQFYFDAGGFNKINFLIKSITNEKLVLATLNGFEEQGETTTYLRRKNTEFADKLLQELDS